MPEIKVEVKTFEVHYLCDSCGQDLNYTGGTLLCHPPLYEHYCSNPDCSEFEKFKSLNKKYPTTITEII